MEANAKVNVNQWLPDVLTEGINDFPAISLLGQMFTADWHIRLILAGLAHRMSFGTISGAADITMVGDGTAIELEVPEAVVAIDSGYLIPMSLNLGINEDLDAENEELDVLLTADRATGLSAAEIATATGTAGAPDNMLDGAPAFTGRSVKVCTADIVDPVHSDVLFYSHWECLGANPLIATDWNIDKVFKFPTFLAGPCSIILYVGGPTPTFMGSLCFAHIPATYVPTS